MEEFNFKTDNPIDLNHKMILSDNLKSSKYRSKNVTDLHELYAEEKNYKKIPFASLTENTASVNVSSITAGGMVRELDIEGKINWTISYRSLRFFPPDANMTDDPIPQGGANPLVVFGAGSSPRPFLSEINTIDIFPLSKILYDRAYTLNSSSYILRENFDEHQINSLVAQLDIKKLIDAGLSPFSEANSHFLPLCYTVGGHLIPNLYVETNQINTLKSPLERIDNFINRTTDPPTASRYLGMQESMLSANRYTSYHCDSWFSQRNTARNIQAQNVSLSGDTTQGGKTVSLNKVQAFGQNLVPTVPITRTNNTFNVVVYISEEQDEQRFIFDFSMTIREPLISQYWDNKYTYDKNSWNRLIPLSSLFIDFDINVNYLRESFLRIGDGVGTFQRNTGTYDITTPTLDPDLNNWNLYILENKIPLELQNKMWKTLYYSQDKYQTKQLQFDGNNKIVSAEIQYANLSTVPQYLFIYAPLNKTQFKQNIQSKKEIGSLYELPPLLMPISNLQITFNTDFNLGTYNLDLYQLQEFTMKNLQDNKYLRDLVVGKSSKYVDAQKYAPLTQLQNNQSSTPQADADDLSELLKPQVWANYPFDCQMSNGISNMSFFVLKLGSDIRLPVQYTPSMLVNYEMTIRMECDVNSPVFRPMSDKYHDLQVFKDMSENEFNELTGSFEVVFYNKKLYTIFGDSLQNVYSYDILIAPNEYADLKENFIKSFRSMSKDYIVGTDAMIGGAFMSKLKDKAKRLYNDLEPKVNEALNMARTATDFSDKYLKKIGKGYEGGMMDDEIETDPHVIMGNGYEDPHTIKGNAKKPKGKKGRKVGKGIIGDVGHAVSDVANIFGL